MSSNQVEIDARTIKGSRRRCARCDKFMIRVGGYQYQDEIGQNVCFTVGRICMNCSPPIFYVNPKFINCKIIFDKACGGC